MVGEQHDLGSRSDVGENAERSRATIVIELNKHVVDDEGHRLAGCARCLNGGKAQREEQLVPRTLTHAVLGYARPVRSHADEDGAFVVDVRFEPLETAQGHLAKQSAGPEKERRLILVAVVINPSRE